MGVEIIFKIAAIGILTAVINQILKKYDKDEVATLVSIAGLVIVLIMVIDMIASLFDTIKSIFQLYSAGAGEFFLNTLFRGMPLWIYLK